MSKLYWMIGLSGSGKSYKAEEIAQKENAIIVASDKIRKELYGDESIQGNPKDVFYRVNQRIIDYLKIGKNVVFDATNISLKNRGFLFKTLKDNYLHPFNIAVIMTTPFKICQKNNRDRGNTVPEEVIRKQMNKFNIPFFEEGFNAIIFDNWFNNEIIKKCDFDKYNEFNYSHLLKTLTVMSHFNQKNQHHLYSLVYHCIDTYRVIKKFSDDKALLSATLLHDIGKLATQTIDEDGIAHYYNHANVGCYMLLQNLDLFSLSRVDIINTLFYINYHMYPYNWKNEKIKEKYIKIFGREKFNNLILLKKIDRICSMD